MSKGNCTILHIKNKDTWGKKVLVEVIMMSPLNLHQNKNLQNHIPGEIIEISISIKYMKDVYVENIDQNK